MTVVHNLEAFQGAVDAFTQKHAVSATSLLVIQAKLLMDGLAKMSQYSPVLTGYLRYNFQLTIGHPAEGKKGNEGQEYPGAQAGQIDPVEARALASLRPFSIGWITNNADYAEIVNNGTEKREAALMLERTVSDLTEELLTNI